MKKWLNPKDITKKKIRFFPEIETKLDLSKPSVVFIDPLPDSLTKIPPTNDSKLAESLKVTISNKISFKEPKNTFVSSRFHFNFRHYNNQWTDKIRFKLIAALIRWEVARGKVVVLIGQARTGKTLLCKQAIHGNVLNASISTLQEPYILSLEKIPKDFFAIDEGMSVENNSFINVARQLITKRRGFLISFQVFDDISRSGLDSIEYGLYPKTLIKLY